MRGLRFRFQVWDLGFEFPSFRFQDLRIQGSEFEVFGFRSRVEGSGQRVEG